MNTDEHHDSDDVVTPHHELTERLNNVTRGIHTGATVEEDQTGGSYVHRETKKGRNEETGRKRGESKWFLNVQGGKQDNEGDHDVQRDTDIEHRCRQWKDQNSENSDYRRWNQEMIVL